MKRCVKCHVTDRYGAYTTARFNMAAEEDFPGLNKRHGFFRAIERNQRDRDDYHHKMERKKQVEIACYVNVATSV